MPKHPVDVRRATPEDGDLLVRLVERARLDDESRVRAEHGVLTQRVRVLAALERSDVTVYLACAGQEPVGALTLRLGELLPLTGAEAVHVEQLFVDPDWRRRGVARQLLAAAATTAEHYGSTQMVCATSPGVREAQRFLARLGFAPLVVHRVVPLTTLRRRLAGEVPGGRRKAAVDLVLAQRRQARAKTVAKAAAKTSAARATAAAVTMGVRPAAGR